VRGAPLKTAVDACKIILALRRHAHPCAIGALKGCALR
jgi:hypothetical protein